MITDKDGDGETDVHCWVCGDAATHRDTNPPYELTCDDHALSIDAERFREAPTKPEYADLSETILGNLMDDWHDLSDRQRHLEVSRAKAVLAHELTREDGVDESY